MGAGERLLIEQNFYLGAAIRNVPLDFPFLSQLLWINPAHGVRGTLDGLIQTVSSADPVI